MQGGDFVAQPCRTSLKQFHRLTRYRKLQTPVRGATRTGRSLLKPRIQASSGVIHHSAGAFTSYCSRSGGQRRDLTAICFVRSGAEHFSTLARISGIGGLADGHTSISEPARVPGLRRQRGVSLLAGRDRLFGGPADTWLREPSPELGEILAAVALAEAKKAGATYADIRINRYRQQYSGYRLSPERGGSKTDEVPFVTDQASFGFGVRVIAGGQWGFAASPLVSAEEIARITREAVVVAKANAVLQASPVQLALLPAEDLVDRWTSVSVAKRTRSACRWKRSS